MDGAIERVIALPDDVNHMQLRFGFEGVAIDGSTIVVAFEIVVVSGVINIRFVIVLFRK